MARSHDKDNDDNDDDDHHSDINRDGFSIFQGGQLIRFCHQAIPTLIVLIEIILTHI